MTNNDATQTKPVTIEDAIQRLKNAFCVLEAAGMSIRTVGEKLPVSPLDQDDICPEWIIPAMAKELMENIKTCWDATNQIEKLLHSKVAA